MTSLSLLPVTIAAPVSAPVQHSQCPLPRRGEGGGGEPDPQPGRGVGGGGGAGGGRGARGDHLALRQGELRLGRARRRHTRHPSQAPRAHQRGVMLGSVEHPSVCKTDYFLTNYHPCMLCHVHNLLHSITVMCNFRCPRRCASSCPPAPASSGGWRLVARAATDQLIVAAAPHCGWTRAAACTARSSGRSPTTTTSPPTTGTPTATTTSYNVWTLHRGNKLLSTYYYH